MRSIILQHCVSCHQQLDLLQLRLVNFDDLITGVQSTIKLTQTQLQDLAKDNPIYYKGTEVKPVKLKKV